MHRFGLPVAADGFRKSTGGHLVAENLVSHLLGLGPVSMGRISHRITHRANRGPFLAQCEGGGNLGDEVRPLIDAAMGTIDGVMDRVSKLLQNPVQSLLTEFAHS